MKAAFLFLLSFSAAAAIRFSTDQQVLDLRQQDWEIAAGSEWKPVRVGMRWDEMGRPELKRGNARLRLRFTADASLQGRKVGFFATLIDDEADVYLNGAKVGSARFSLGDLVRGPAIADLTSQLRLGQENELLLEIRDTYVRSTGVVGNVCLFQTLPYERTRDNGIRLKSPGPVSVILHVGDAILSRGSATSFAPAELAALSLPPYILREDELVLAVPAAEVRGAPPYRVDLDAVAPIKSSSPLSVRCDPLPASVPRYGLLSLTVALGATYDNPFDPAQINVQALVETPSGRIEKVPAFFRQEFRSVAPSAEEEILLPVASPAWRVYYRPRELGVHKLELIAQDRIGIRRYAAGTFQSAESGDRGYLRVSKRDPQFFEYDNGDSFFGIGPSGWFRGRDFIFGGETRWVSSRNLEQYYERKAANRSTYEYLGTFHFGQLLLNGGIIDQHIAWKLEHALRTMERLGIHWLFFHDDICRMSRYGFEALPYAKTNGGPANEMNELYFSEPAVKMQKDELRYLVGRMADSPSIWMWNIGDEWRRHFGNKFSVPMVRSWIQDLHATVKQWDIYGHPHAIGEGKESILNGGDVFILEDWYLNHLIRPGTDWREGPRHDLFDMCTKQVADIGERRFPTINVEGGLYAWNTLIYHSGQQWGYPEAITFHQHLWLGLFLKNAASGTDWLVNVLDRDNNLVHAKGLAQFLDGENLTAKPFVQAQGSTSESRLNAYALANGEKTLAWVVNRTWNWLDHVNGKTPQPLSGQTVTVPVPAPGAYQVEFWDTVSGAVKQRLAVKASGNLLTVPLPAVTTDLALKCLSANAR